MKIVAIIGSPRPNGNTSFIIKKIAEKLQSLGDVDIEYIFLSDTDIQSCRGCCACLITGEENCPASKDDLKGVEEKLLLADGVIFASPVYAMNMPALMKNLLDRLAFTMHRPRFFNQYTMIVAVTGAAGLRETIGSLSQIKYCGFNIVKTVGIVGLNPLSNPSVDNSQIKKVQKATEIFYNKIKKKEPLRPSLNNLLQYRVQKEIFVEHKDSLLFDWNYFNERGWLDKDRNYYVNRAKINFFKNQLAKLLVKFW